MARLLIGAPVLRRAWIITEYLEYADKAARVAGFAPDYLFVAPTRDPTVPSIVDWVQRHDRRTYIFDYDQPAREDVRDWNTDRYTFMVELRNFLLQQVRMLGPDFFLSLDSDILLHPKAIKGAMEGFDRFDAVGLKAYLSVGTDHSNYANMVSGNLVRIDFEGFAPVDVIMAAKLMTPPAYHVDYALHLAGEDIGWSLLCRAAGVKLGFDGRHPSKHVMEPQDLTRYDHRVGW